MRTLKRNQQPFYYALYKEGEELVDANNRYTGLFDTGYTNPIVAYGNIAAATGVIMRDNAGDRLAYDKIIVPSDANIPIAPDSVLWIDAVPEINPDGTTDTPWDYEVKLIARSLNSLTVCVKKVKTNG